MHPSLVLSLRDDGRICMVSYTTDNGQFMRPTFRVLGLTKVSLYVMERLPLEYSVPQAQFPTRQAVFVVCPCV
jgi:hypothetical protein